MTGTMYNYDTELHDPLAEIPQTREGLLPYVPKDNPAYRNLFNMLVENMGRNPIDAYVETLSAGRSDR